MRRLPLDRYERDVLGVALIPALCVLALVALLIGAFAGWTTAGAVALISAFGVLLACFLLCARRLTQRRASGRSRRISGGSSPKTSP